MKYIIRAAEETEKSQGDCISREALKKHKVYSEERREYIVPVYNIDNAPTVEPKRPQGEWIPCTKTGMPLTEFGRMTGEKWYGFKCSNPKCNYIYKGNALTESPFCQKCGADMKGGKE